MIPGSPLLLDILGPEHLNLSTGWGEKYMRPRVIVVSPIAKSPDNQLVTRLMSIDKYICLDKQINQVVSFAYHREVTDVVNLFDDLVRGPGVIFRRHIQVSCDSMSNQQGIEFRKDVTSL